MTTTSGFTPFSGEAGGLTRVTPFTHRDNATFLQILQEIVSYLKTTFPTETTAKLDALSTDITTTKTAWDQAWADFKGNIEVQIALLNDGGVRDLITNLESATSDALDARYAQVTDLAEVRAAAIQWLPNKPVVRDQKILTPDGDVVTALQDHTTGAVFDPSLYTGNYGWVFAGHSANDTPDLVQERLQLFYSPDGRTILGGAGNPLYKPASTGNSLRDPVIKKSGDTFFMCYTANGGQQKTVEVAQSTDLVNWKLTTVVDLSATANLVWAWAPELVQDTDGSWVILFTSVEPYNGVTYPHTIWWMRALNPQLSSWSAPQRIFWDGSGAQGPAPIDAAPIRVGDKWYIFYGNDGVIHRASADTLTGTWTTDKTGDWAGWAARAVDGASHKGYEGPEVALMPNGVVRVYLDAYINPGAKPTGYVYSDSSDGMVTWTAPARVATGPEFPTDSQVRHGTWLKLNNQNDMNKALGAAFGTGPKTRHAEFYATGGVAGDTDWTGDFIYDEVLSQHGDEIAIKDPGGVGRQVQILRDGVYALHFHFTTIPQAETGGGWISIKSPDESIFWCSNDIPAKATAWSVTTPNRFIKAGTILKAVYHATATFVALGEVRLIITKVQ